MLLAIAAFFCAVIVRVGATIEGLRNPERHVSAVPLVGTILGTLAVLLHGRFLWLWVPLTVEAGTLVLCLLYCYARTLVR